MKRLFNIYIELNPLVIFFPFFIIFIFIILRFNSDVLAGDEGRYYDFAKNLINGFYSPPAPDINLWSGPGYPLFLVPFVWLNAPLVAIKLANAVFQYFSIVLLYHAINRYVSRSYALLFSFAWASYYISYQELYSILTEPLTSFLCSLILFLITQMNNREEMKVKYLILAGFTLGFLALTKIIFGYVILGLLAICGAYYFLRGSKTGVRSCTFLLLASIAINVPYLIYTYNLTGKVFYWGNSGGSSLYWMSTPVEGEFGDWNNSTFTANCGHDLKIPCNSSLFAKNHQDDIDYIGQLPIIDQDDAFKEMALNNIKNNPLKYFRNLLSNFSRLFFGIPNSYFYQREQTIWRILPNSIVLTLLFFSTVVTLSNFRRINFEVKLIAGLTSLYILLSLLVSAYPRQLYVVIPFLFFWFAYILKRALVFNFRLD
jgi:hypothetical protein